MKPSKSRSHGDGNRSNGQIDRKLITGSSLTSEQGARAYGVVQALDAALSIHKGDIDKAILWLYHPAWGLGGERPADILTTAMGVWAVIDLVGQIEHNVR